MGRTIDDDMREFDEELRRLGETEVTRLNANHFFGDRTTWKTNRVKDFLRECEEDRKAQHRQTIEFLARDANRIAAEANAESRNANAIANDAKTWSRVAAVAAIPTAVALLIAGILKLIG